MFKFIPWVYPFTTLGPYKSLIFTLYTNILLLTVLSRTLKREPSILIY